MSALPPISPSSPSPGEEKRREEIVGNPTSPDIQRDYGARNTQQHWQEASLVIIQEIASQREVGNWQSMFEGLAEKRNRLAYRLDQNVKGKSATGDGNDFGILRSTTGSEILHIEKIEAQGAWRDSYPKCRRLAIEYAKDYERTENYNIIRLNISGILNLEKSDESLPIRCFYPSAKFVAAVMGSAKECEEADVSSESYRTKIDAAYADLFKPERNLQEFRYKAAKFYYLVIRLLPCHRGTASIIDWMMRGIALKKGYALGRYNHEELGWDLRALLTPPNKLEEYCQWFRDKAFN